MNTESSQNLSKPIKPDTFLTWRGVFFQPSAEQIKAEVKEKAKIEKEKQAQMELTLTMYELFGSGKKLKETTLKTKAPKLVSRMSHKESTDEEEHYQKDKESIRSLGSVREGRKNESFMSKRKLSCMNISKGIDVRSRPVKQSSPVHNLNIIFQQNRPQQYFGIRKPKNFDSTEEKEGKDPNCLFQNETVTALLNKHKNEIQSTESSRRASAMHKASIHLTTCAIEEIRDRFSCLNKTATGNSIRKGSSIQDDVLEILNKLATESIVDKYRLLRMSGYCQVNIPDFSYKIERSRIMDLFVSKYYRSKHPKRQEATKLIAETDIEKELMKNCVLNNKLLSKLMTKRSFYPYRLQVKLADIDASLNTAIDDSTSKANDKPIAKRTRRKYKSTWKRSMKVENILDEIGVDIGEFSGFYEPLLKFSFETIVDMKELLYEKDVDRIKRYIQSLSYTLSIHRNHPGSLSRILTQQIIKAGETNQLVLNELINHVEGWLDQILKTLLSQYASIRLEAFITLSFLFSKPMYVTAIQQHIFNDVMYDVVATVLRCFDLRSEDFDMYYSLLGVVFYFAPCQTILDCLIERAPYSYHIEVVSKWPRFLFLALKYWTSSDFNSSSIHLKRTIEILENHWLRESLSRKYLKEAISCIAKRFNLNSTMFTTWPKHTSFYPD